jgi:hypothetical protein
MASTTLTKTFASTGNRKTWTFSAWVKRTSLSANVIFSSSLDGNNFGNIEIDNNNRKFQFSTWQSATTINLITSRVFRDTSAWYHIVVVVDTTQSTESNRVKLYVNGIQETVFDTAVYPSQNSDNVFNVSSYIHRIGVNSDNNGRYFDGLMSHIHFIDGTAYDASAFGQADANGVWTIKTSPSVTYGTNGFFILKNGNSVTDQSGNSNNWTVGGGTLTNTEDNPSNVFATLNSLNGVHYAGLGFSNGNNSITTTAGQYAPGLSTLGVSTGKWYGEFKMTSSSNWSMVGVTGQVATATDYSIGHGTTGYGYTGGSSASGQQSNNNSLSSYGDTYNNGDIIGIALDLDNNKLYFSKNGTFQNSGDPT